MTGADVIAAPSSILLSREDKDAYKRFLDSVGAKAISPSAANPKRKYLS